MMMMMMMMMNDIATNQDPFIQSQTCRLLSSALPLVSSPLPLKDPHFAFHVQ